MQKISLELIQPGEELVLARPVILGSGATGYNSGVKVTNNVVAALMRLGFSEIWIADEKEQRTGVITDTGGEHQKTQTEKFQEIKENFSTTLADIMTEQDPQKAMLRIKSLTRNSILMQKGALTEILPSRQPAQIRELKKFSEMILPIQKLEEFRGICRDLIEKELSPWNIAKTTLNLSDTRSEATYIFNHMANCGLYFLATITRMNADLKARGAVSSELRFAKGVQRDKNQLYFFADEEILSGALGAFMHDIGYLHDTMPAILAKEGLISREEHGILKKHVEVSMNILGYHMFFDNRPLSKHTIEYHHERLDGSGYPKCKKNFHAFSRVLGLIDVFDSMVTDRPWRKKFARSKVLEWLFDNSRETVNPSGEIVYSQFDREVLLAFERVLLLYEINEIVDIYHVKSDSPVFKARVKANNEGRPDRPLVELISCYTDENKCVAGKEVNMLNIKDLYIGELTDFEKKTIT